MPAIKLAKLVGCRGPYLRRRQIFWRGCHACQGATWCCGVGGVASGWQAYAKILVGADLVQLYTGIALNGPELPTQILQELVTLMQADGVNNIADAKGQIPHATKAIQHATRLSQISATQPAKT